MESGRGRAAIPPPSTLNDAHLPKIDDGKKKETITIANADDSPLSQYAKKMQELRTKLQHCRESNKKYVVEEEREKIEGKRADLTGKKRKRKDNDSKDDPVTKRRTTTAEEAQWQTKIAKKKAKASGVMPSPYNEDASYVSFKKRTKNVPYSQEEYEAQKEALGDKFYPDADSLDLGKVPELPESNVNRMVRELNTSQVTRYNFSRRRAHNDEKNVDYINERNKKFNEKLERAYNKYTVEIRQNLERGTAL